MAKYIVRRLMLALPTVFFLSIIVFSIIHLIPGDPIRIMFGDLPDPEQIAYIRRMYNLDEPVVVQYLNWLSNIVKGDMGVSIVLKIPVVTLILERLPRTIYLCLGGIFFSLLVSFPCGVVAAWKHNKGPDLMISSFSLILLSVPSFFFGVLLILAFSVNLKLLPTVGYVAPDDSFIRFIRHMILPSITLGTALSAVTIRVLRISLLEVLEQDYITLARAKGARETRVLFVHALKNALITTITVIGMQIGHLLGGAIVVERVFAYPGMGLLLVTVVSQRDYPVIQAFIMTIAVCFVVVNLVTDVVYAFVDPKIKYK